MFHIYFKLTNPWKQSKFKNIWCKSKLISQHKVIEGQLTGGDAVLFGLTVDITHRQDHAGVFLEVGLLGYTASVTFYDCRHWDNNAKSWCTSTDITQ